MTVHTLVLGATGPIGHAVMAAHAREKLAAIGLSRSSLPAVDLYDPSQVHAAIDAHRPRTIIYLANPSTAELANDDSCIERATDALAKTLQSAALLGTARFVFASSAAVYGTVSSSAPIPEAAPTLGNSPYALLKIASEQLVWQAADRGCRMEAVSARIFNVFGPGCRHSLLNTMRSGTAIVWDTDKFVRDYIHVDDVAASLLQLAKDSGPLPRAINVGTGEGVSNEALIEAAGDPQLQRIAYVHPPSYSVADVSLAVRTLGFRLTSRAISYVRNGPTGTNESAH